MVAPNEVLSQAAYHYSAGEFPRAEQLTLEILRGDPKNSEAWRLLGGLAFKRNDPARGFEFLKRSIECDPKNADAWLSLAQCYHFAGDIKSAIQTCESAVQHVPDFVDIHVCLAHAHRTLKSRKAIASYERAIRLLPDNPQLKFLLAECLQELGELDRAISLFRQIREAQPRHAGTAAQLGRALSEQGRFEEAVAQLRASVALNPVQPNVFFVLSQLAADGWCELTPGEIDQIRALAADPQLSEKDRADAAFALGSVYHKRQAFDEAMDAYHLANGLARQHYRKNNFAFDSSRHDEYVDRIIATHDRAYFELTRNWGVASSVPIFIVGMPRSGTTLVEQILANHPGVFGAGEVGDMRGFWGKFKGIRSPDRYTAPTIQDAGSAQNIANAYLEWMRESAPDASHIINKSLENYFYLGTIATLFPKARIIHCHRDPLDVCLACYFANFLYMPFSCAMEDIGAYHRSYDRLMTHWKSVLPVTIHHVRYEALIDQPKEAIRDLLAFCELDWDDLCLEFHKSRRVVATSSAAQVRKPIYKSAVGRWVKYRAHLGPLVAALGLPASDLVAAERDVSGTVSSDGF